MGTTPRCGSSQHGGSGGGTPIVRLGAAVTTRLRSRDLLARLVDDVDARRDRLVRAVVPAASAALPGAGAVAALTLLSPAAGVALARTAP